MIIQNKTLLAEAKTVFRIKRKRNEGPIDALLVAKQSIDKRLKINGLSKVFTFIESIESTDENILKLSIERALVASAILSPQKSADQQSAEERQVLPSKKLNLAKDTRFKIVNQNQSDGLKIVDIELDEGEDEITRDLMPMVRKYLNVTESCDYVYDLYHHDKTQGVYHALTQNRVGTLEMDTDGPMFMDDGPSDSDIGSSDDSNAEDYYTHDYPENDGFDEVSSQSDYGFNQSKSDSE